MNNEKNLYKNKYLKYKNKYLNLVQKSMSGGSTTEYNLPDEIIPYDNIPPNLLRLSNILKSYEILNIDSVLELTKIINSTIINYNSALDSKNAIKNENDVYNIKLSHKYIMDVLSNTHKYLIGPFAKYIKLYDDNIDLINKLLNNGNFTYFIKQFGDNRNEFKYTYDKSRHTLNFSNILLFKNNITTLTESIISNISNENNSYDGPEFYEIIFFYIQFINNQDYYNKLQLFTTNTNLYNTIEDNLDNLCNIMHAGWAYFNLYIKFKDKPHIGDYELAKMNDTNPNTYMGIISNIIQITIQLPDNRIEQFKVPLERILRGQFLDFKDMLNYSSKNFLTLTSNDKKPIPLQPPNKFGDDAFAYTIWVCRHEICNLIQYLTNR